MQEVAINDVVLGVRHRKDLGDIKSLADSINEIGLLHPVVLRQDNVLIAGGRRLAACKSLGWKNIPARTVDLDDVERGEYAENVERKDFAPSEVNALYQALHDKLSAEAKERQTSTLKRGDEKPVVETFHDGGKTRDKIGDFAGRSGRTVEKINAVCEAAEKNPEYAPLVEEMDKTGKVDGAYRKLRHATVSERTTDLPEGKYRVIYADPPWKYSDERTNLGNYSDSAATAQYPTMSVDELCGLDVKSLTADDAVLFCWATFPLLPDALEVVKAWGFKYKTAFVWDKERANMGNYHNASAELLLICTKGSCTPEGEKRPDQVQTLKREGRHSEKPEHFRELIDSMYPSGPRIELFRRGDAPEGWHVWGNEAVA